MDTTINIIGTIAYAQWVSFTFFVMLGGVAQLYKTKKGKKIAKNVDFVVVTCARESVRNSLLETVRHLKNNFNQRVIILIDEGADMQQELIKEFGSRHVFRTPENYRKDLVGKGRAMNYFIEKQVKKTRWYSFVDDDNLVMDDKFLYEIPVYDKLGYVATNPVLKARKGRSTATFIMDSLRYFDDITIFRFFTGLLKKPLMGLHGELLTVKGAVLLEIGYNFHSLTEDFRFATKLVKKGYKTWQSDTVVSIKSPNTIGDLLKQRGRWFKGILLDIPHAPVLMQIVVGWRLLLWVSGIFGSWAFFYLWQYFNIENGFLTLPAGIYYTYVYTHGVWSSRKLHYFFLIPVLGIIETVSFISGIKQKTFVVINKN